MDIDYNEVFEVDAIGAEEPETAEPAERAETEKTGEREQEIAEPAEEDRDPEEEQIEEKPAQSMEERARFAAVRRKAEAERDAAIARVRQEARAEAQKTIDEAFRRSGLTDPYTKKPITSQAEFEAYRARFEAEKKARLLKKSGMTDAEFDQFVSGLPEVQEAKRAKAAAEAAARQAQMQQAQAKISADLEEIRKMDPQIHTLQDLIKQPNGQEIYRYVQRGNSFLEAYYLANRESIQEKAAAAARQQTMNQTRGKEHLTATQSRGRGTETVPPEIKAAYLELNPTATAEEIQAHYNKYLRK